MPTCEIDPALTPTVIGGYRLPLGVYPLEPLSPRVGYTLDFEPADGTDESGEWEEWPDRYVFDIVISADRLEALIHSLFGLFLGRILPIVDVLGHDAYREIDSYIAYAPVGLDRLIDAVERYRPFFLEDGLVGFGAMSKDPFIYVFVDEHKVVTVRIQAELKERVERLLAAFDLEQQEAPAGPDSVAHEHRTVLRGPPQASPPASPPDPAAHPQPGADVDPAVGQMLGPRGSAPQGGPSTGINSDDFLTVDEIVEILRDELDLVLNINPDSNVDDDDADLGVTGWRCLVRCHASTEDHGRYAEVWATAGSYRTIEDLSLDAARTLLPSERTDWEDALIVAADRVTPPEFAEAVGQPGVEAELREQKSPEERIYSVRWLE